MVPAATNGLLKKYPLYDKKVVRDHCFSTEEGFIEYLSFIKEQFEDALTYERQKLYYAAKDIPLFWFLSEPKMLEYKFYFWSQKIKKEPIKEINPLVYRLGKEVFELYKRLDSEEIWSVGAIQAQREQLFHLHRHGILSLEKYKELLSIIEGFKTELINWAKAERKDGYAPLALSQCNKIDMSNGGMLLHDHKSLVMGAYSMVNFYSDRSSEKKERFDQDWLFNLEFSQTLTHRSIVPDLNELLG